MKLASHGEVMGRRRGLKWGLMGSRKQGDEVGRRGEEKGKVRRRGEAWGERMGRKSDMRNEEDKEGRI